MRPPPDAEGAAPPLWRSSSPAFDPRHRRRRSTASGNGQLYSLSPPLNLSRLGSGGVHRASTPGAGGGGAPGPPSSPPAAVTSQDSPATEADVWAALACAACTGCADPALGALADAADGAGGVRIAPAVPFMMHAPSPETCPSPALVPHLAHPDSVQAPAWLERLVSGGEASTSAPSIAPLPPLAVVVGCRGAWLAVPPPALAHWERGGPFTPAGGPQAVSYIALAPRGSEAGVDAFLTATSAAWAAAGLGAHTPAGGVVPGADARGVVAYDADGGLPALARAYAALHLALTRSRPPVRWPGLDGGGDGGACLFQAGGPGPDGSLVVYVLPPTAAPDDTSTATAALRALIACARAPTAPPPPPPVALPQLSRLYRSSDGGGSCATAGPRLPSDAGSTPDWSRSVAARDTYRRESGYSGGGGGGSGNSSRDGSPALGVDGPAAATMPCTLQVLPVGAIGADLTGLTARRLAFAVFNKVAAASRQATKPSSLHYQPLVALHRPAGPTPALHCAFALVPPEPSRAGAHAASASAAAPTLVALAFTDGTGELAPSARVVRVAPPSSSTLPAAVLAACGEVFTRATACATRDDTRPTRMVITRLGAPPPGEAAAWQEAVRDGGHHHHPPTTVLALSADPPFRLAGLGDKRPGSGVSVNGDRACIFWETAEPGAAETVRAGVVARVAGGGANDLAAAAGELHALGVLATAAEAVVGGWGSPCAHLPGHCATACRLARLAAAAAAAAGRGM